jgi:hypothetical protein
MHLSRTKIAPAVLCGATGLSLTAGSLSTLSPKPEVVHFASNAAFRDGLYQGKLDAQHGSKPHIRSARWSAEPDRLAFVSGYRLGYQDSQSWRIALTSFGSAVPKTRFTLSF